MTGTNFQSVIEKLDEFIRKYYKNRLLRGLIYSTGLVLLFFISATVLEYYAHFNTLVRTGMFYFFLLISGIVLVKYIAIPLSKLYKLGQVISYEEAADIIGKHFSNVQDKLLNVLQLQQLSNNKQQTTNSNQQLIEASISQKTNQRG